MGMPMALSLVRARSDFIFAEEPFDNEIRDCLGQIVQRTLHIVVYDNQSCND